MDYWRFKPADYAVGVLLYVENGYSTYGVTEYVVVRVTPKGQVVAERDRGDGTKIEIRVTPHGKIVGADTWSRRRVVSSERAEETRKEAKVRAAWTAIRSHAEAVDKAARGRSTTALKAALADLSRAASGILTGGGDAKQAPGESLSSPAFEEGDAQT